MKSTINMTHLVTLHRCLHPLHREKSGQICRECGQHEDDEEPVRGHQDAAGERLGGLTPALWGEGRQSEPERRII